MDYEAPTWAAAVKQLQLYGAAPVDVPQAVVPRERRMKYATTAPIMQHGRAHSTGTSLRKFNTNAFASTYHKER